MHSSIYHLVEEKEEVVWEAAPSDDLTSDLGHMRSWAEGEGQPV